MAKKRQRHDISPDKKKQGPTRKSSKKSHGPVAVSESTATDSEHNWVTALAKQSTSDFLSSTKQERIERRKLKKERRQGRKAPAQTMTDEKKKSKKFQRERDLRRITTEKEKSRMFLLRLTKRLHEFIESTTTDNDNETDPRRRSYSKIFRADEKRGKATAAGGLRKTTEKSLQPRKRDYGGLGLARPSLFLSFEDPSFVPKFEEEFEEHVPGFFGKQRTKAMKKQLDGKMLWRRMRDPDQKVNGKKLSDMTPDQRVEAMLKAGML